nr:reverse transcriptase domain-containing protein [Tanacetum cinerariifolium]
PKTTLKATTPTTLVAGNTRELVDNAPPCYKCGGLGHFTRDCPNLKTLAFVPDDAGLIYNIDAELEVDEPGDELVYPDHGESLVNYRILNVAVSKSVDDNSWFRNNIFRTKCTSKGKKSDKDEVWCELIPMDADHILLRQFINEFDKLRMRCDVVEEEEQVVAWFWESLSLRFLILAKSKGSTNCFTSRFTPPTRTAPPTAPKTTLKATTPTTLVADRDDRYRDDPIRILGLKIEIPEFTTKVHPDDFINRLSTVERVFDVRDILDKLKMKLIAIKL